MAVRSVVLLLCLAALAAALATGVAAAQPVLSSAVSIGDSYSSGEGTGPPFDPGTNVPRDRCHRGPLAWPRLLGVPADRHLACSGAGIANLAQASAALAPDDRGQLARLAALAVPPTDVFVTLGGNDAGFAAVVRRCVIASCVALARQRRADLPALGARLEAAYRSIAAAAPGARVIAVDYPQILPSTPPAGPRCLWLSDAELPAALGLLRALDATIAAAAERAGVEYVRTGDPFDGHELCTRSSWMFPIILNPFSINPQQGHPRPPGQVALARRVGAYLEANPAAPPAPGP